MEMEQLSKNEKTESITFRLPTRILEQIELEAKQNNVSENVLVKQILTNYVDWFRVTKGSGIIPVSKESLKELVQNTDGVPTCNIIENIQLMIKNFSIVRYGRYDLSTALDSLSMYIRMSNSQLVHLKEGSTHRFLINHNLGITWSLILERLINTMFGEFIDNSQIKCKTADDSIIASMVLKEI